jgi:hypothetical protein
MDESSLVALHFTSITANKPVGTLQAMDETLIIVVRTKIAFADRTEAQSLVEAMGCHIGDQWIDDHGRDIVAVDKTIVGQGNLHHLGTVALSQVGLLADPNINGAQIGFTVLPPNSESLP